MTLHASSTTILHKREWHSAGIEPVVSRSRVEHASHSATATTLSHGHHDISRTDYANGYALYAYDLTPDLAENDHVNLTRQGTVRLDLKFGAALAQTVTVIAYAEFENVIEIDRNRNIVFDFSN